MKKYTLRAPSASTASETSTAVQVVEDANAFRTALFVLDVSAAATAAGDTLDVYVDTSLDGITWINAVHFTQVLGNGGAKREIAKLTADPLADPDNVLAVDADAAVTVVRNVGVMPYIRHRSVLVDATTDDASFTYSLVALLN
jgi:hypothetical protein